MSATTAGLLQALALAVAVGLCWRPLGDYMARIFTTTQHLRVERGLYRVMGVNPDAEQTWPTYMRAALAFGFVSLVLLYALLRLQQHLPFSEGFLGVNPQLAWNTAASFVTNTNWQNYGGESTMGYTAQAAGLVVEMFTSGAMGIAISVALIRGFARSRTDRLGNFWVDVTRTIIRLALPMAIISAGVLIAVGGMENFNSYHTVHTLAGSTQTLPGGPVASQESIKDLFNNGGGFFNQNSAHPYESPSPFSNVFTIFMILVIPFALARTFGVMVRDKRQGLAITIVMAALVVASFFMLDAIQTAHPGPAPQAAGAAMEGQEVRFGVPGGALFADSTTGTSTGSINSAHDSYTALGGGVLLLNMMYSEVAPGGVGSGLYSILAVAVITVFIGGLMVGRTPEYIRKKIRAREMQFASLYFFVTPGMALVGTGIAIALKTGRASILNPGPHGLSEILYAFTSMANNNGSAFAGLNGNTDLYNTLGGIVMLIGRILEMVFVVALAGSLARQKEVPVTVGTVPTHRAQFIGMLAGVIIILTALTYLPALALGPLAEGLH